MAVVAADREAAGIELPQAAGPSSPMAGPSSPAAAPGSSSPMAAGDELAMAAAEREAGEGGHRAGRLLRQAAPLSARARPRRT